MLDCFAPATTVDATPIDAVSPEALEALADLSATDRRWLETVGFKAKKGEVALLPAADGELARVLFGLGSDAEGPDLEAGRLPTAVPEGVYQLGSGFGDGTLAAVAWALGGYRFDRYRDADRPKARLVRPNGNRGVEIETVAGGVYLARDLINTPANDLGPAELAAAARDLAARHDAGFEEIAGRALDDFPLIAAVGAAAAKTRGPRLIDLTWGEAGAPKVTLVGKGVCFDTGGLDLKPAAGMSLMKKDMGGAAAVLGLAAMIMAAELPVRLRVLIPAVENAVAGKAFRPGDVFRARSGLTVEIGNTDAEGRLVLADAMALAVEEKPDLLIDLATLTGAARVAVGPDIVPFYTHDDKLAAAVIAQGAAVADPMWRLPLWQPYARLLESKVADINNAGASAFAGSITAALFLSRFVPSGTTWLHGDIFGWTPAALPGRPVGGEAQAIRALFALLKDRIQSLMPHVWRA